MTTVRITCPDCGDIVTTPDRITVTRTWNGVATWRTTCQHCHTVIISTCRGCAGLLLERAGAWQNHAVARPAELDDPTRRTAPTLTALDVTAFAVETYTPLFDDAVARLEDGRR